ncbi:MAG: molybdopterin-dependent oxidoreductase [Thermoplasmata archaeon]
MTDPLRVTNALVGGDALGLLHDIYLAFPYPARRILTVLGLMAALVLKPWINRGRPFPTTRDRLYTLSFWGVPALDATRYRLHVHGQTVRELALSLSDLEGLADTDREVVLDCVGGTRNVVRMRGVSLRQILAMAKPQGSGKTAVFRCADGYREAASIGDLLQHDAFLAFQVNDEGIPSMGYPLRLAFPGKYGYKWAKWVTEIELVEGSRKGTWESVGLPDRANVGDIF